MSQLQHMPEIVQDVIQYAQSKKADEIVVLDIKGVCSAADYFVICHADSEVQVKAISNAIEDGLRKVGHKPWHKEGYQHLHWVLLDYVDVVVHVFYEETRRFYNLERLWGDAKIEQIQDESDEN